MIKVRKVSLLTYIEIIALYFSLNEVHLIMLSTQDSHDQYG